ncbi:MAG: WYL domain-containing protein [Prevotella sp.]|nr:WYL domain-containing protein [Bacteroidales bacterium]MDD6745285.1 WYL domain-containing protein [Bacteroidales bacterium]MDY3842317.1 WYL domain-containing protein [Prevotella sp.]
MRHDKLGLQLDLLLLMTENHDYTAAQLCDRLGISLRNLYYYLDFFRDAGFRVIKSGTCYRLDRHSPFFRKLHERIDFTEQEAILLRRLTDGADETNPLVESIRRKLDKFYDLRILTDVKYQERISRCVSRLYEAIKYKRIVKLCGYSSPHSRSVTDRLVEPFLFMNDNMDVRCYEISTGMNKTFKVSRMADVQLVDMLWSHESQHRQVYTDAFMFSGEDTYPVSLVLGQLSANLLGEEVPRAATHLTPNGDGRQRLQLDVCSYVGIGRFVLGLYDDIEVLGDDGFRQYLRERIARMQQQEERVGE